MTSLRTDLRWTWGDGSGISTLVLCGLLAALHGGLALAIAGVRPQPSLVIGIGIAVAVGGYVVAAPFPLSDVLAPWQHVSPWDWAFGGDPLTSPTEPWRYVALLLPAVGLAAAGTWSFGRRYVAAG